MASGKQKVAILGGGPAALTAAWFLSSDPGWQDQYEITLYQMGWRLGGKCASGRNAEHGHRIEEHGIHILMGFYENLFKVIQDSYAELDRPLGHPMRHWQDGFEKHSFVGMVEPLPDTCPQEWMRWLVRFPEYDDVPGGQPYQSYTVGALKGVLAVLDQLVAEWLPWEDGDGLVPVFQVEVATDPVTGGARRTMHSAHAKAPAGFSDVRKKLDKLVARVDDVHERVGKARPKHRDDMSGIIDGGLLTELGRLLELVAAELLGLVEELVEQNPYALSVWQLIDLCLAVLRGMIRDEVLVEGWDAIEDVDFLQWLKDNGLTELSWNCPAIRAGYSLIFAFPIQDNFEPWQAAGSMMRALSRIALSYRGSVMWKMKAGTADVIFSPIYEVLARRGVQFRFFHEVKSLHPDKDDPTRVGRIKIHQQVELKGGDPTSYQPLVMVKGLECWPSEPLWHQIKYANRAKAAIERAQKEGRGDLTLESAWLHYHVAEQELVLGQDFDQVVLGISVDGLRHICEDLPGPDGQLHDAIHNATTVASLATQAWLQAPLADLGWQQPSVVMTGDQRPLDTWADMSEQLPYEDWHGEGRVPHNIAYFCGAFPGPASAPVGDPTYPARAQAAARSAARNLYTQEVGRLWPSATSADFPNGVDLDILQGEPGDSAEERLSAQYFRVNIDPSERFVIDAPNTVQYRLDSDGSGYRNLFLCGDWINNGVNTGCVEAAAMTGMLASQAMCGRPSYISGLTDFDHGQGGPDAAPESAHTIDSSSAAPPTGDPPTGPTYVDRIGVADGPAPIVTQGVKAFTWVMEPSKAGVLQGLCNRYLNDPRGDSKRRFVPLMNNLLLMCMDIDKIYSEVPEYRKLMGSFPECDFGFWIFVGEVEQVGPVAVVKRLALFPVTLFVNQPTGLISGRETWGFPKTYAELNTPRHVDDLGPWKVAAWTVTVPGGPSTLGPMLEVTRRDDGTPLEEVIEDLEGGLDVIFGALLGDAMHRLVPGLELLRDLPDYLAAGSLPVVFLKEFRDGVQPKGACYQAVTECSSHATYSRISLMKGDFTVQMWPSVNYNLTEVLGLPAKARSLVALYAELDAGFGVAKPCGS